MWIIRFSIENPVKVTVAVLFLVIFGSISVLDIPIQMTPTVDKPEIQIRTVYEGAAPQEIEEQITIPIEEKLQAVEGLKRITSTSSEGRSNVELEFEWGVNKDIALIDIVKRLARVRDLPVEADAPIVIAGTSSERRPIYWASLRGNMPVDKMRDFADDYVLPRFERVEGVAEVRMHGGEEREIRVALDFKALGARGLSVSDVRLALARENLNVRGGSLDIGKRRHLVRTVGLFQSIEDIESVIIAKDSGGAPIYVRDVATVYDTFRERSEMVRIMGRPAIAFGIIKKTGSNTIEVVNGVEAAIEKMNEEMAPRGIAIYESYDSSDYIWESIDFVSSNLGFGAGLAVVVLILFLKSIRSTLVIGVSIPIVIFSGFILLNVFGRTLNIVSLAGMAFAVGMVVDNAIVALENIYRHLQMGKGRAGAALDGAVEVWGAILASTLTTLAVFVPIIFVREEAGQLFKDIAIAISVSVFVSLIVSVTVIPAMTARFLAVGSALGKGKGGVWAPLNLLGRGAGAFFVGTVGWLSRAGTIAKLALVAVIIAAAVSTVPLTPKLEYLPKGNRNLIFIAFTPHVGSSLDTTRKYSDMVADRVLRMPEVKYMFHVISSRFNGIGVRVKDEYRLRMSEVADKINEVIRGAPGFKYIRAFQSALFSRSLGGDVEIDIRGPDLDEVASYSNEIMGEIYSAEGVGFARSNLDTGNPEIRVKIDRERAADLGLSVQDVAETVEALVAGKLATLYKVGGEEIDIVLKSSEEDLLDRNALERVTIFSMDGVPVRLGSVARIEQAEGPTQINHIEMDRSVTLSITKKTGAPLQAVVDSINEKILGPLREKMELGYHVSLSGHAADLDTTAKALSGSFVLAVIIIYLLMAALFESFLYPLVIMLSVPLAASGAILGVYVTSSSLDVLTMLGFIILAGIVVNNAILLIHQVLRNRRARGMSDHESVVEAVKVRVRPIFMSSITTVCGMLPLVVRGGAGSELYSGLAAAIVGGLTVSTIFTLVLVPAITLIIADAKAALESLKTR
ncbi:MAG: efflux RND transporter permease subunit [Candidatus Nitrospinota bacterium M3_3B_026]